MGFGLGGVESGKHAPESWNTYYIDAPFEREPRLETSEEFKDQVCAMSLRPGVCSRRETRASGRRGGRGQQMAYATKSAQPPSGNLGLADPERTR